MFGSAPTISRTQHDRTAVKFFTNITGYDELYTRNGGTERDKNQKKVATFPVSAPSMAETARGGSLRPN
jgi:hypothetical protein